MKYIPVSYYVNQDIRISNRDPENRFGTNRYWVVSVHGSNVLNKDCELEHEPLPSSRDEAFISRTRFSLEEAEALVERFLKVQR